MMLSTEDQRLARLTDVLDGAVHDGPIDEAALDDARVARALLDTLPDKGPPRDFLRRVQRRVRRRSGGRYFHPAVQPPMYRISIEVFAVIAVAVMAACYFFIDAGQKPIGPLVEEPPPAAAGGAEPGH